MTKTLNNRDKAIELYTQPPGATQAELASMFGVTQSAVSRWLKGQYKYKEPPDIEAKRAMWRRHSAKYRMNKYLRYSYD